MTGTAAVQSPRALRALLRRARRRQLIVKKKAILIEKSQEKCDSVITVTKCPPTPPETPFELPTTQRALVVSSKGTYTLQDSYALPEVISSTDVLVRPHAVGLNPIDWKSVSYNFCLPSFPWITGRELAGTVVRVHPSISHLRTGDRVWTSTYYQDVRASCFQEYVVVPQHTVLKIPENVGYEEAACLGVPGLTAAMTLWKWLGIGWPPTSTSPPSPSFIQDDRNWLLIWGGSAVTGQFATQLAVHSGWRVITVTSERTKSLSLSLGASYVVSRDGKSGQEIVNRILEVTQGNVTKAIDLVGPKTAALVLDCVSKYEPVDFAPLAMMASDQVAPDNVTVHTVEMKQFVLDPTCRVYAEAFNELISQGKIAFPDMHILDGGLEQVVPGLEMLRKGDMGGRKLVVRY